MCALQTRGYDRRHGEALACLLLLSIEDLRAEWRRLYGRAAPTRISRELLIRAIAYRIQERAFGGLGPELSRQLSQIAGSIGERGDVVSRPMARLKPGTRLLRDWHGRKAQLCHWKQRWRARQNPAIAAGRSYAKTIAVRSLSQKSAFRIFVSTPSDRFGSGGTDKN